MSKFVQITAVIVPGDTIINLNALDDEGQVWYFHIDKAVWVPVPMTKERIEE